MALMIRILLEDHLPKGTRMRKFGSSRASHQERRLLLPGGQGDLAAINGVVEHVRLLPIDRRTSSHDQLSRHLTADFARTNIDGTYLTMA